MWGGADDVAGSILRRGKSRGQKGLRRVQGGASGREERAVRWARSPICAQCMGQSGRSCLTCLRNCMLRYTTS